GGGGGGHERGEKGRGANTSSWGGPGLPPPLPRPPLERAELPVLEPPRVRPLQPEEQGLGLQPGTRLQLRTHFFPDVRERILPGPPLPRPDADLAGKLPDLAILPRRFLVHVRPHRRGFERLSRHQRRAQPTNLPIRAGAHGDPPSMWRIAMKNRPGRGGK